MLYEVITLQDNAAEMLIAQEDLEKSNKLLGSQIQEVEHAPLFSC